MESITKFSASGSTDNLDEVSVSSFKVVSSRLEDEINQWTSAGGIVSEENGRYFLAEADGRIKYVIIKN